MASFLMRRRPRTARHLSQPAPSPNRGYTETETGGYQVLRKPEIRTPSKIRFFASKKPLQRETVRSKTITAGFACSLLLTLAAPARAVNLDNLVNLSQGDFRLLSEDA